MRIAVYAIAKDEAHNVKQWAHSCADADFRVIVDTGSSDKTVEIARECGVEVHEQHFDPWRFDVARNLSLSVVPEDVDLCISLDLDEVLVPGWREEIERSFTADVTRFRYLYTWSWNEDGTPGLQYAGDKIHSRHGYEWKYPVHEVLIATKEESHHWTNAQIHHHRDQEKSRAQYLPLLEIAVSENLNDDRNAHYLAREYMYSERFLEAAVEFKRHLALPTARWNAERAQSMRYLAICEPDSAEDWLRQAIATAPARREPWVDLAFLYMTEKRWLDCLTACEEGLVLDRQPLEYLTEAHAWGSRLDDMAANASFQLHFWERAAAFGERAVELEPTNQRLQDNLLRYQESLAQWSCAREKTPTGFTWVRLPVKAVVEVEPPPDLPQGWSIMNPSVATDGRRILMTVRSVNYELNFNQYSMADNDQVIRSRTGLVDVDLGSQSSNWRWIDDSDAVTPDPLFPVQGVEDLRLFHHQGTWRTLGAVRDFTEFGATRQVLSELTVSETPHLVMSWRLPSPLSPLDDAKAHEKNWVIDPSGDRGLDAIWSTQPLVTLRLDSLTRQVITRQGRPNLINPHLLRGSTPMFNTPHGLSYVVHQVGPELTDHERPKRTYLHAFVVPCEDHVHVGRFWVIEELALEFVAGACLVESEIFLSFGRDDRHARLAICDWNELENLMPALCL